MHKPVLLQEVIKFLEPESGDFFIDGTINGGGHSAEIIKKILPNGMLLGIDWDKNMLENSKRNLSGNSSIVIFENGNYADLPEILRKLRRKVGAPTEASGFPKADGLLLDLGFSSEQLESSDGGQRGFSFLTDGPLLMTYSDEKKPVKEILKRIKEKELADIIYKYSGEKFSRQIARAIKIREKTKKIETTGELNEIIKKAVPKNYERGRISPATRTFQALRIYANDELENLKRILNELPRVVKKGGRVTIISFHSLEDKIVKNSFRDMKNKGILEILTKKPITPSNEEIKQNPRSRSAKLRAGIIASN